MRLLLLLLMMTNNVIMDKDANIQQELIPLDMPPAEDKPKPSEEQCESEDIIMDELEITTRSGRHQVVPSRELRDIQQTLKDIERQEQRSLIKTRPIRANVGRTRGGKAGK